MKKLYSIYDQKTRNFEAPMMAENDEVSKRTFKRIVESVPQIKANPEDFDLFLIGHYSEETANIDSLDVVQKIANGLDCVNIKSQQDLQREQYNENTQVRNESPIQSSTES